MIACETRHGKQQQEAEQDIEETDRCLLERITKGIHAKGDKDDVIQRKGNDIAAKQEARDNKSKKTLVVSLAHTIIQPDTVMIFILYQTVRFTS